MSDDWERGFVVGYAAGIRAARPERGYERPIHSDSRFKLEKSTKQKRKRPTSKKQKLLKTMTDKKWKTYKGKKTWIQIRAQVSRSQAYKKKARRL